MGKQTNKVVVLDVEDREITYESSSRNFGLEMHEYRKTAPNEEADFALECIKKWGMVAGTENGEDSAGRAKLKLSSPEEVVERAFTIAKLAMNRIRERDMLIHFPSSEDRAKAKEEALNID